MDKAFETEGKIIRGVGGFYYVDTGRTGIYECRPRGIFRKEGKKPLVGDNVRITVTHEGDKEGSLDEILPRKNQLVRPAAANIDQVLLIFAAADPRPNLNLLDRFLISMQYMGLPVILLWNKKDLVSEDVLAQYMDWYSGCGAGQLCASVREQEGIEEIREILKGKTTMLAGPSGVGKSSLMNLLSPHAGMDVGELSRKIRRGKQTTRHTQLCRTGEDDEEDSFLLDTPGFGSLFLPDLKEEELPGCYPEFRGYSGRCRFQGCMHISEPDCAVKDAVGDGRIPGVRYDNYRILLQELRETRRY